MRKDDFVEISCVFRKDLLDLFRDYRSLIIMLGMPILIYPLFLILPAIVATKIKSDIMQRNSKVAVVGDFAPLLAQLKEIKSLTISPEHDMKDCMNLLSKGKLDLIVEFPKHFSDNYKDHEKVPEIKLIFNQRKELSLVSAQHVSDRLSEIKEQILKKRTNDFEIKLPNQYRLTTEEVAVNQKELLVSDPIRNVVPFLLFTMVLVAISYPAIDLVTGERERKSLAMLLLTPTKRENIVLGKLAVIATCALATVGLGLVSIVIIFTLFSKAQTEFDFSFSGQAALYCFLTSVPLVISLSALAIYLASWCKTFQQGQGYFVPFLLFVIAGTGVCSLPELTLSSGVAFIPILNTALGIKEFLTGSPDWFYQIITTIVSVAFAFFVVLQSSKILDREDLMFDRDKPKQARWKESDYAVEVGLLLTAAFLLMFYLGQSLQQWDMSYGSILTQLMVVLAPSLILLKYVGRLSKKTLSLVQPSWQHLLAALFVSPACIFLALLTHMLQNLVFPAPEVFTTIFTRIIVQADKPLIVVIASLALAPAICEEIMFRGAILGLVRNRFGKWGSIFFVGILFGLFHLSIFRILPTAVLGIVLTFVTIYTGSIYPAMLIHLVNNTTAILLTRFKLEETMVDYWPLAVISGLIGLFLFWNKNPKNT